MLAEVLQSEGSHEMEFDGVYQIMVFTLYQSANWKCPKCGKTALCFLVLYSSLVPFLLLFPHLKLKAWFLMLVIRLYSNVFQQSPTVRARKIS